MKSHVAFRYVIFGLALCAVVIASAPPGRAASTDSLANGLRAWMQRYDVPTASLAIMQDGNLVGSFGFGGWQPAQPQRNASLSKAITGVCVARLAQEGRLAFRDTLGAVLAKIFQRLGEPADPRFKTVTIEQLLQHRGGLARDVPPSTVDPSETLEARFRNVMAASLAYNPGSSQLYSNIGYLTLGIVVEAVTGQDYETACRREALDPMRVTGVIDPMLRQRAPNGGWLISAIDYARFVQVFDHNNPVLSPTMHAWLEAQAGWYGMGTFVRRTPDGLEFYHTGKVAGHLGGGSITVRRASGWSAVIIFGGPPLLAAAYRDLRQMIDGSLPP